MIPPSTDAVVDPEPIAPADAADQADIGGFFSAGEIQLTVIIFIFGLLALLLFFMLVKTGKATPFLMRIYVVLILVFGTLLVLSSSYTTKQIAPLVGFFGTIAGYLLGRTEKGDDDAKD